MLDGQLSKRGAARKVCRTIGVGLLAWIAGLGAPGTAGAADPGVPAAAPAASAGPAAGPKASTEPAAPPPSGAADKDHVVKLGDVAVVRFRPGTGAVLSSTDHRFSLALRARMQLRYDLEIPHEEGEEIEQIFQVRRMRLQFQGHAFGEHNRFYVQLGLSPRDMTGGLLADEGSIRRNPVRDARVELDYLRDLTLWVGQMKVPFSRQRVISSGNLQMVDRALTNEEFQLDRDLGIQLLSRDLFGWGQIAYHVGLFLGEGRNAFEPSDAGMLWVGRLVWLPMGTFDDDHEGDLSRSFRPHLAIAGAYAFHDDAQGDRSVHGSRPADGGTTDYHHVTADLVFKHRGFAVQAAFHYREGQRAPGDATDENGAPVPASLPRNGWGLYAEWSYLLPWFDLQPVVRWVAVRSLDPAGSSLPGRNEAGLGLSYYFAGHPYKLQLDYARLWDEGPLGVDTFGQGTDRLRLQVQLSL